MAIVRPNIYGAGAFIGDPLLQEKRQRSQQRSDHLQRILQAGNQAYLRQNAIDSALSKQKEMYQDLLSQGTPAEGPAAMDQAAIGALLESQTASAAQRAQQAPQTALSQMVAANAAVPVGPQLEWAATTPAGFDYDAASGGAPQAPIARGYGPPPQRAVVPDDVTARSGAESQANANTIAAIRQAINDQRYGWMGNLAEEYTGTPQDRRAVAGPRERWELEEARLKPRLAEEARLKQMYQKMYRFQGGN